MRILITGHQGYIGSVMTPYLAAAGHDVVGLDTGVLGDGLFGDGAVTVRSIRKDVRDVTVEDVRGFDGVVHLAALANDPLGDLNPDWTYDINHRASVHLARTAKEAGVTRFVFSSSCSMYGDGWKDELLSEDAPMRPLTPYAVSKARSEEDIATLADGDFTPVYMRNGSAYGISSHLRADLVLNNLMGWAFTTGNIRILSDGSPWRPIVHVEDIAMAFAQALTAPKAAVHNQAFNVGPDGENYQVRDLARIVIDLEPRMDARGFFSRTFCQHEFADHGLKTVVAQCNLSFNHRKGTLRGLHYQLPPATEAKLIRCVRGAIRSIIVDLRPDSTTYLSHIQVTLSAENRRAVYVPEMFANGYQTLTDDAEAIYQVSEFYTPDSERGLRYSDPRLRITLPLPVSLISEKDAAWPLLQPLPVGALA